MPLKIGIMLDDLHAPAWMERMIEDIQESAFAKVSLLMRQAPGAAKPLPGLFQRYLAWDRRIGARSADALAIKDLAALVPATCILDLALPGAGKKEMAEKICQAQLDVILCLSRLPADEVFYQAARYGVWSCWPVASQPSASSVALFWKLDRAESTSMISLHAYRSATGPGQLLNQARIAIHARSLCQNLAAAGWKASRLILQSLHDLHRTCKLSPMAAPILPAPAPMGPVDAPATGDLLRYLSRRFLHRLRRPRLLMGERWSLALRPLPACPAPVLGPLRPQGFRFARPPTGYFIADPFPFEWEGKTYVFLEESVFWPSKGVISYFELDAAGCPGPLKRILERPYHLSYPFILEWRGNIYMIPETSANRTVELYRAVQFPDQWQLERVLMQDVVAVDTTLIEHQGRLWMFVGVASEGGSSHEELHIYYADSLLGPWSPHAANPVVADVTHARPAGRLFYQDGKLIRPAQDCSATYGGAVNFCEIRALSPEHYEEAVIARMSPPMFPGNTGLHTYNSTNNYEVIDYKAIYPKPIKLIALIPAWCHKLIGRKDRFAEWEG